MNYAEKRDIEPLGTLYRFTQEEITALVNDYVKEKVGAELNLIVDCMDDNNDVYIEWNTDGVDDIETNYSEEQWRIIEDMGIISQEWFITRDAIFQAIFEEQTIGYYYHEFTHDYEITVYNSKFESKNTLL